MRLIDADELKNVLEGYSDIDSPNPYFPLDMVEKDIDDAPTDSRIDFIDEEDCKFCYECGCDMRGENDVE